MLQGRRVSSQRMHRLKAGERWPARAKPSTQINNSSWNIGAMIIEIAATRAMKVIGPLARARTESQSVALLEKPCRLILITG
ncbi:hypothetical protein D3C72_1543600 [compost metagenome]